VWTIVVGGRIGGKERKSFLGLGHIDWISACIVQQVLFDAMTDAFLWCFSETLG